MLYKKKFMYNNAIKSVFVELYYQWL